MAEATEKPVKKAASKGSKNTEIIVGQAAMKLTAATKALQEAVAASNNLEETIAQNVLKASTVEDQISDLKQTYAQQKAEMEFQLSLDYKTNKKAFADAFLNENGLTAVPTGDFNNLKEELEVTKKDFVAKVNSEVGKVKGMLENDYVQKTKIAQLEFDSKQAETSARLSQKEDTIKFLNEQVAMWKGALDAERAAGVERSKAGAIGSINLGQQGR